MIEDPGFQKSKLMFYSFYNFKFLSNLNQNKKLILFNWFESNPCVIFLMIVLCKNVDTVDISQII